MTSEREQFEKRARELHGALHVPGHPDEANCIEVVASALADASRRERDAVVAMLRRIVGQTAFKGPMDAVTVAMTISTIASCIERGDHIKKAPSGPASGCHKGACPACEAQCKAWVEGWGEGYEAAEKVHGAS